MSKGTIKFEGVWRDKSDRAMPIIIGRNGPGKRLGDVAGVFQNRFLPLLASSGHRVGYFAIQDGNQLLWTFGEDNIGYRRHGKIGDTPNLSWAGRVGVGIKIPGFEGTMDVVGGGWENAVYKVTLGDQVHPKP